MAKISKRVKKQRNCLQCGQIFFKAEHLERHIRSHTKERPFSCGSCHKVYSRHDSLLRHLRTHGCENNDNQAADTRDSNLIQPAGQEDLCSSTNNDEPNTPTHGATDFPTATEAIAHQPPHAHDNLAPATDHPLIRLEPMSEAGTEQSRREDTHAATVALGPTHQDSSGSHDHGWYDLAGHVDMSGLPVSMFNTPTDLDYLDIGLNPCEPACLLGQDFNIDVLTTSISSVISDFGHNNFVAPVPDQQRASASAPASAPASANALGPLLSAPTTTETVLPEPISEVQRHWHTRFSSESITPRREGLNTPAGGQGLVDDTYREDLSHRLQHRISHPILPSADFLNLYIKLYFARFNPVFPLIHAPSFRSSSENALLLLSICSVGALFIGSPNADQQGREIFQVLNKAVLASWEKYISRDTRETLSLIQAALIGQTFGLLSGHPQDLCMTDCFSGTVIAWARQSGFFKITNSLPSEVMPNDKSSLEQIWKSWAQTEEIVRLVLGLHIHDSEFATIFHHEPLLPHAITRLPMCSSEELFLSPSAGQWCHVLSSRRETAANPSGAPAMTEPSSSPTLARRSEMFAYALLASILALIQQAKASVLDDAAVQHFRDLLMSWHGEHHQLPRGGKTITSLMILWHTAFMALYSDLDLLERGVGRDGRAATAHTSEVIRAWATSSRARRSVLHALLILKHAEALPIGLEPAIHVPKSLFHSAIVIYCYIHFANPHGVVPAPTQEEITIPELQTAEHDGASSSLNNGSHAWPTTLAAVDASILCNAIDLMRRIGHGEISRRFAVILQSILGDIVGQPHHA